jgi:hypothetical protein
MVGLDPTTQPFIGQSLDALIKCDHGEKSEIAKLESEWV